MGGVKQGWGGKQAILKLNASISRKLWEIRAKLLLMTNKEVAYVLSIDTKIDDLG